MKLLLLVDFLLILVHIPWSLSLELRKLDDDAYLNRRASPAVTLSHRNKKTSQGTFILDRNSSHSVHSRDSPVSEDAIDNKIEDVKADIKEIQRKLAQPMRSTPHGICMYSLPERFNTGLLNSTFKQPVPIPLNISPVSDPPLQGMFDTIQFSLERIFYDRFLVAADQTRPAKECVMFYVPYFVAWETSSVGNTWLNANRPALDAELFTHLTHYNDSGVPGRDHFIVIGRISFNVFHFLERPIFENMVKLVLEDTAPGQYPNVFAIPYPTWFRYYPGLEPGFQISHPPVIKLQAAALTVKPGYAACKPAWVGNLSARISSACDGRQFCSYHVKPQLDDWEVGGIYEARDANGAWWPVTITEKNADGTFGVSVHDGPGTHWPKVYKVNMRRHGKASALAAQDEQCPTLAISGQFSCGGANSYSFESLPGQTAVGKAVVLGCPRGPCWLWGACQHRTSFSDMTTTARSGPLLSMIGSARETEYERHMIFKMCEQRPMLCAVFHTGARENSTSFVHSRIADMYQLLMASTFCVNPPGDTPTRKGLFDSLVLGCIPVITSEDSMQHYAFHVPFWRSISVLVTTSQLFTAKFNLVDFLEDYERDHPQEIAQKQEAIRRAAFSLQYSYAPSHNVRRGPDAFDKTLEHLLARPHSPSSKDFVGVYHITNAASGRRLFARSDGDYGTSFGASAIPSAGDDVKWHIKGRGDGSCCYSFFNIESKRSLYAQVNATDWTKLGAAVAYNAMWADMRWRLRSEGLGTYSIVNVASGRRLFATPGQDANIGVGATLTWPASADQRWKLEKIE